jgi:2-phosphosulfolactate phosphatase
MSLRVAKRSVTISCFGGEMNGFAGIGQDAIVAVDVIRATTTAITAVALGRKCFPVASLAAAARTRRKLKDPLLVGELGGEMPRGFDLTNSPAAIAEHRDVSRPMILLSTSGMRLVCSARGNLYLGCLRNYGALVSYLPDHHENIILMGAETRGSFREEDKLCCAWIAAGLLEQGYVVGDSRTRSLVRTWAQRGPEAIFGGDSSQYLLGTGQLEDLRFILDHINDLDCVAYRKDDEVIQVSVGTDSCLPAVGMADGY